jgi:hypothetical protein
VAQLVSLGRVECAAGFPVYRFASRTEFGQSPEHQHSRSIEHMSARHSPVAAESSALSLSRGVLVRERPNQCAGANRLGCAPVAVLGLRLAVAQLVSLGRMTRLASILIAVAFAVSAQATSIAPPDHDWTVTTEHHFLCRHTLGVRSWGSRSFVFYGFGFVDVPFSFWPVFSLVCGLPVGACAIPIFVFRRRHEHTTA